MAAPPAGTTRTAEARLLGAHMPTAGGLHKSLISGSAIGCTAVQLFTGSPRQWSHPPLESREIDAFLKTRAETDIRFLVAHDSYLINLAAPAPDLLDRSRAAFRTELDRAELLGIPWVVTHMGARVDQTEAEAIGRLVASLRKVLDETDAAGYTSGIALETTAGQGTGLGWRFEQIAEVLQGVGPHARLGVCFDTCHVFAAGYDLRTEDAYAATWAEFDALIGLDLLKVIHANDAKKPLGSRVDRHEHIGQGAIGAAAFTWLVRDPVLRHVPIILETPDSETMHAVNLGRLKRIEAGLAPEIRVAVQCFGPGSDIFGKEPLDLSLLFGSRVQDVATILAARDPRFADLAAHCRFAVNEEYVELDRALDEGDALAVLPPMSGG